MRKSEKEIRDRAAIDAVIRECPVCRLGLCDAGEPYIVPLMFGYDGEAVYFHCATEGRKLDILRANPRVCVEFDILDRLLEHEEACRWSIAYRSVIGVGVAAPVDDPAAKRHALALIMAQYAPERTYDFPDRALQRTSVYRIALERVTGKQARG